MLVQPGEGVRTRTVAPGGLPRGRRGGWQGWGVFSRHRSSSYPPTRTLFGSWRPAPPPHREGSRAGTCCGKGKDQAGEVPAGNQSPACSSACSMPGPRGAPQPISAPPASNDLPVRGSPQPWLLSPPSPHCPGSCQWASPASPFPAAVCRPGIGFSFKKTPHADIPVPSKFISAGMWVAQPLPLMRERSSSGGACAGAGQPRGAGMAAPVALLHLGPPSNLSPAAHTDAFCV